MIYAANAGVSRNYLVLKHQCLGVLQHEDWSYKGLNVKLPPT
uniref:Uncharacterized protein n=1 Tax=Arundo donax TaxID=35708 RepID=A0A0A9BEC2_ARUDO